MDTNTELETKAGVQGTHQGANFGESLVTHGELMRAFEAFKDANDERVEIATA